MGHYPVRESGHGGRNFAVESQDGAVWTSAAVQHDIGYALDCWLHSTAGKDDAQGIQNGFFRRLNSFAREIFIVGISDMTRNFMA
ncbi:hypothetical protein D3C84_1186530 [compost metagenome]